MWPSSSGACPAYEFAQVNVIAPSMDRHLGDEDHLVHKRAHFGQEGSEFFIERLPALHHFIPPVDHEKHFWMPGTKVLSARRIEFICFFLRREAVPGACFKERGRSRVCPEKRHGNA